MSSTVEDLLPRLCSGDEPPPRKPSGNSSPSCAGGSPEVPRRASRPLRLRRHRAVGLGHAVAGVPPGGLALHRRRSSAGLPHHGRRATAWWTASASTAEPPSTSSPSRTSSRSRCRSPAIRVPVRSRQREELWQQILAFCPPEHQELVRLKLDGLSLDEIAARPAFTATAFAACFAPWPAGSRSPRRVMPPSPASGSDE